MPTLSLDLLTWGLRQRVADAQMIPTDPPEQMLMHMLLLSVLLYDSRGVISLYLSAIRIDQDYQSLQRACAFTGCESGRSYCLQNRSCQRVRV